MGVPRRERSCTEEIEGVLSKATPGLRMRGGHDEKRIRDFGEAMRDLGSPEKNRKNWN